MDSDGPELVIVILHSPSQEAIDMINEFNVIFPDTRFLVICKSDEDESDTESNESQEEAKGDDKNGSQTVRSEAESAKIDGREDSEIAVDMTEKQEPCSSKSKPNKRAAQKSGRTKAKKNRQETSMDEEMFQFVVDVSNVPN